jgi:hypothetical protein
MLDGRVLQKTETGSSNFKSAKYHVLGSQGYLSLSSFLVSEEIQI